MSCVPSLPVYMYVCIIIVKKRRAMRDDDTGSPCRNEEVLINSIQKRPIC